MADETTTTASAGSTQTRRARSGAQAAVRSASASVAVTVPAWSRPAAKAARVKPFVRAAVKGPAFEGGQTPWAAPLTAQRAATRKRRATSVISGRVLAVVNLHRLSGWDASIEVTPESLKEHGVLAALRDGVKILGAAKPGNELPAGLRFRDVVFSQSAREALTAAGATIIENI